MIKNIYILPTDKPSILIKDIWKNTFSLLKNFNTNHTDFKAQNIYITSDEEIKEGDLPCWCLSDNKTSKPHLLKEIQYIKLYTYKKIILTTDQDLIAEGVQEIPDGFLKGFVKNPNCKDVYISKEINSSISVKEPYYKYKIIIPKEQPKQETELDAYYRNGIGGVIQETLEEAAENWLDKYSDKFEIIKSKFLPFHFNNRNELNELINEVIKWQQERMYSEEEVKEILTKCTWILKESKLKWFEQFKKK